MDHLFLFAGSHQPPALCKKEQGYFPGRVFSVLIIPNTDTSGIARALGFYMITRLYLKY
jgi:hypothetical protein